MRMDDRNASPSRKKKKTKKGAVDSQESSSLPIQNAENSSLPTQNAESSSLPTQNAESSTEPTTTESSRGKAVSASLLKRSSITDSATNTPRTSKRPRTDGRGPVEPVSLDATPSSGKEVDAAEHDDGQDTPPASKQKRKSSKPPQATSSPKGDTLPVTAPEAIELAQRAKSRAGRPKGSKNKKSDDSVVTKTPKKRGRPPGSLNKRPLVRKTDYLVAGGVSNRKPRRPSSAQKVTSRHVLKSDKKADSLRKRLREDLEAQDEEDGLWGDEVRESAFVVATKVLKAQVKFLVKKGGASKMFDETVFRLWNSYLTVALPDVADGMEETVMAGNKWLNALRDPDFCVLLNCKTDFMRKTLREWKIERYLSGVDIEIPEGVSDGRAKSMLWVRTKKEGRSRVKSKMTELSQAELQFEGDEAVHDPSYHKKLDLAPERLTMTRIVALIALALYMAEERTLISDLLRWIRCMQFPYSDTKLKRIEERSTWKMLYGHKEYFMMSYHEVEYHIQRLYSLLDLGPKDFPVVSVAPVVERFVEELNLPREFLTFVLALMDKINSMEYILDVKAATANMKHRAFSVELLVMTCVFHALRFIFGLDGKAEKAISAETKVLAELVDKNVQLFDFEEWKAHLTLRGILLSRFTNISPDSSLSSRLGMVNVKTLSWRQREPDRFHPVEYIDLQKSFQTDKRCRMPYIKLEDYENFILLPPTLRPYRAHTEALGTQTHPELLIDYDRHSLSHVLVDDVLATRGILPPSWNVVEEDKRSECLKALGRLKAAQAVCYSGAFPVRAHNVRTLNRLASVELVRSSTMQWLIRMLAGMIEHDPKLLLGQIMYVEMGMFANNIFCKAVGVQRKDVLKMRSG